MMERDEQMREQAAAWAVRTGDPAFDDWDAFTQWLEEHPAHAPCYDEIMLAAEEAVLTLPRIPEVANDHAAATPRTGGKLVGGAVAAVVAVAAMVGVLQMRGDIYAIETAPGETRLVELEGGDQIAIAGGSRLVLDRSNPQFASLEHGQALFTLRHDQAAPLKVTVGEVTLVDVGTVFDVRRRADGMTVAVSEGAVLFNPGAQNVRVEPGQMLSSDSRGARYEVTAVAPGQVGEWRQGRVTFDHATLAEVADDLSRATGHSFNATAASADARVSGSLLIEPVRSDPRTLGPLLGVNVQYAEGTWEIGIR